MTSIMLMLLIPVCDANDSTVLDQACIETEILRCGFTQTAATTKRAVKCRMDALIKCTKEN